MMVGDLWRVGGNIAVSRAIGMILEIYSNIFREGYKSYGWVLKHPKIFILHFPLSVFLFVLLCI